MRDCVTSALPDTGRIDGRVIGTVGVNGSYTAALGAAKWTGACRVNPKPGVTREITVGDAHAITSWYVITLPYTATGFVVDDYFRTTASALSVDLVDRPLRIIEIEVMSWELGRRLTCHDESAGETPV